MRFLGRDWTLAVWDSQHLNRILAIDTETTRIVEHTIPHLITFQVTDFDSNRVFFVRKEDLPRFFNMHSACRLVFHNAAFDLDVITQAYKTLGMNFPVFDWIESGEVYDTAILYRLYMLASNGQVPMQWNLAKLSEEFLSLPLEKDNDVRLTFDQYYHDGITFYDEISKDHMEYAARDVIVTYSIYRNLMTRISKYKSQSDLTQCLQVAGDFTLKRMRDRGIGVNVEGRNAMLNPLIADMRRNAEILATYGWVQGTAGVQQRYEWIVNKFLKLPLPLTTDGSITTKIEDLEKYSSNHFVKSYIDYHKAKTVINFLEPMSVPRLHPRFNLLKNTGRTSCDNPNLQNIPRAGGVRELFVPKEGHKFFIVDYSFLELCTLAQTCFTRYGFSRLRDIINAGRDPHRAFASDVVHSPEDQITKEQRQAAKACYSADTELLTKSGWKRIDALYNDFDTEIAQYNPHTKEIEFTKPYAWTTKGDKVIQFINDYQDTKVSADHRMLMVSKSAGYVTEILAKDYGSRDAFCSVHGGNYIQSKKVLSELETRLAVAIQADGSFQGKKVRAGFTKSRKIERFKWLLDSLKIVYVQNVNEEGVHTFKFNLDNRLLDRHKSFINNLEYYDNNALIDEVWRWDGSTYGKHGKMYCNTKENDVDFVQTILVLNGYKSSKQSSNDSRAHHKPLFNIYWYCGDRKKNIEYCRLIDVEKIYHEEFENVYCPTVPTSWVLTRRNGKVVVHGNCNFGFPGGLGIATFLIWARDKYGVNMSFTEGENLRNKWFTSYPEMNLYMKDTTSFPWTITGRVRANADYCASKNCPFQGLAADGNKLALFNLEKAGFRPLIFIHDEIICEEPVYHHKSRFEEMKKIMIDSMKMVVPDVDIKVEGHILDKWEKK